MRSFADPVELFGDPALELPGLARARADAWQWGNLNVSGFGAYTMRTEYGLIFGRDEEELGFRRYDPFLTATREASHALPARLAVRGWRSLFLHPHDLRFYNRHRIMPAAGFAEMVGEEHFAPPSAGRRYVTDAAMAGTIGDLARNATEPTVLYAVTIENHGPWAPDDGPGPRDLVSSYLRLVRNSDAMLARLLQELAGLGRPSVLVFSAITALVSRASPRRGRCAIRPTSSSASTHRGRWWRRAAARRSDPGATPSRGPRSSG
jgi:hypothetical protein